ncbi:MAG TPA: hypothetical protein VEA59_03155 [Patescibacteria group bacterium]|nr:hypothetical protein [Patescibacteria group bacterium]
MNYQFYTIEPVPIDAQLDALRGILPANSNLRLDVNSVIHREPLRSEAECFLVIPPWQAFGRTYDEASQALFDVIEQKEPAGRFQHVCAHQRPLIQTPEFEQKMWNLRGAQGSQTLFLPVQLGGRHAGIPFSQVGPRYESDEFPLGPFEFGIATIVYPSRFSTPRGLIGLCPGASDNVGWVWYIKRGDDRAGGEEHPLIVGAVDPAKPWKDYGVVTAFELVP